MSALGRKPSSEPGWKAVIASSAQKLAANNTVYLIALLVLRERKLTWV